MCSRSRIRLKRAIFLYIFYIIDIKIYIFISIWYIEIDINILNPVTLTPPQASSFFLGGPRSYLGGGAVFFVPAWDFVAYFPDQVRSLERISVCLFCGWNTRCFLICCYQLICHGIRSFYQVIDRTKWYRIGETPPLCQCIDITVFW